MSVLSVLYSNNFNYLHVTHINMFEEVWICKLLSFIFLLVIHGTYCLEVYVVYDTSKMYCNICNTYCNRT